MLFRLFTIAYGLAYKMLQEIDWMSLNKPLARLLGISLTHFNTMESDIYRALNYHIGVSQQEFESRFTQMSDLCAALHQEDVKNSSSPEQNVISDGDAPKS